MPFRWLLLTQPKEELHAGNLLEEGEDDKEEREYLAMLKEKQLLYREEGDTTSEEDETEADNLMDKNEADFNLEFLEENRFFISFEKDGTLDWFFHPAYCECASLSDYERLVLQNYVSDLHQFIIVVSCTSTNVWQSHYSLQSYGGLVYKEVEKHSRTRLYIHQLH